MRHNFFLFVLFIIFPLFANEAKGPLIGKNHYIPYIPYYSFPGFGASKGVQNSLNISIANYYVQEMVTEIHKLGNSSTLLKERFADYESYIFEPTVSFNALDQLELGLTWRVHTYYGGIGDAIFEGFHSLFNFPNGGRDFYGQNEVYINYKTTKGLNLQLTSTLLSFGDIDLFAKYNFLSLSWLDLALFGALKLPTGSMEGISGSGYLDLGISLLADFHIFSFLSVYVQNGLIVPGQIFDQNVLSPHPIYSLLVSLEFIFSRHFSLLGQFRLNSSPVAKNEIITDNISYTVKLYEPMTNILAGIVLTYSGYRFQFYFEEDAFTNNGADLILNLTMSKSFKLF